MWGELNSLDTSSVALFHLFGGGGSKAIGFAIFFAFFLLIYHVSPVILREDFIPHTIIIFIRNNYIYNHNSYIYNHNNCIYNRNNYMLLIIIIFTIKFLSAIGCFYRFTFVILILLLGRLCRYSDKLALIVCSRQLPRYQCRVI